MTEISLSNHQHSFQQLKTYIGQQIIGQEVLVERILIALLADGHMLVEGAGALSVACFIKKIETFKNKNVVLIISGSRIGPDKLKHILHDP